MKESENISIYYRESDSLHYEELKFITTYKTTPKELLSIIKDIDKLPEWSYICVGTQMIKKISPDDYLYYYITDTPWPVEDRDVVLHVQIQRDSISGVITVNSKNSNGWIPEKENFVRIKKLRSKWVLSPQDSKHTKVEFYFSSDPGGIIPLWLINSAISYGPIKTLTTLRNRIENQ